MEVLLVVVLVAVLTAMGVVVVAGLALSAWNLTAVLARRWRCHGSWAHPKRAHRGDSERDRSARRARPLWAYLLELPPIPIRRR